MQDSIFTKIIRGEVSSYKVYEDDRVLAFLDIHPIQPGHTLVIPKKQVEFVWDLSDADYDDLLRVTKKVALHLRKTLNRQYVHAKIVGTDVPHAHIHLVPFNDGDHLHVPGIENTAPDFDKLKEVHQKLGGTEWV